MATRNQNNNSLISHHASFGKHWLNRHHYLATLFMILFLSSIASFVYWWIVANDPELISDSLPIDIRLNQNIWNVYTNEEHGFQLVYPKLFVLYEPDDSSIYQAEYFARQAQVLGSIGLPEGAFAGTNYQNAYITMAVSPQTATLNDCKQFLDKGITRIMTKNSNVNGVTFYEGLTGGAAAGTQTANYILHAYENEKCYEISLNLWTSNVGNYEQGTVTPLKEEDVWSKLAKIYYTFKITNR